MGTYNNYPTRDSAGELSDCYPMHDSAGGLMITSVCLSVCLSVGSFDIYHLRGQSRTLYNPVPETITEDRHLVLSVDLDSIDADGLLRNCHLSWHFQGSAILFVYLTIFAEPKVEASNRDELSSPVCIKICILCIIGASLSEPHS